MAGAENGDHTHGDDGPSHSVSTYEMKSRAAGDPRVRCPPALTVDFTHALFVPEQSFHQFGGDGIGSVFFLVHLSLVALDCRRPRGQVQVGEFVEDYERGALVVLQVVDEDDSYTASFFRGEAVATEVEASEFDFLGLVGGGCTFVAGPDVGDFSPGPVLQADVFLHPPGYQLGVFGLEGPFLGPWVGDDLQMGGQLKPTRSAERGLILRYLLGMRKIRLSLFVLLDSL